MPRPRRTSQSAPATDFQKAAHPCVYRCEWDSDDERCGPALPLPSPTPVAVMNDRSDDIAARKPSPLSQQRRSQRPPLGQLGSAFENHPSPVSAPGGVPDPFSPPADGYTPPAPSLRGRKKRCCGLHPGAVSVGGASSCSGASALLSSAQRNSALRAAIASRLEVAFRSLPSLSCSAVGISGDTAEALCAVRRGVKRSCPHGEIRLVGSSYYGTNLALARGRAPSTPQHPQHSSDTCRAPPSDAPHHPGGVDLSFSVPGLDLSALPHFQSSHTDSIEKNSGAGVARDPPRTPSSIPTPAFQTHFTLGALLSAATAAESVVRAQRPGTDLGGGLFDSGNSNGSVDRSRAGHRAFDPSLIRPYLPPRPAVSGGCYKDRRRSEFVASLPPWVLAGVPKAAKLFRPDVAGPPSRADLAPSHATRAVPQSATSEMTSSLTGGCFVDHAANSSMRLPCTACLCRYVSREYKDRVGKLQLLAYCHAVAAADELNKGAPETVSRRGSLQRDMSVRAKCQAVKELDAVLRDPSSGRDSIVALGEKAKSLRVGSMRQPVGSTTFEPVPWKGRYPFLQAPHLTPPSVHAWSSRSAPPPSHALSPLGVDHFDSQHRTQHSSFPQSLPTYPTGALMPSPALARELPYFTEDIDGDAFHWDPYCTARPFRTSPSSSLCGSAHPSPAPSPASLSCAADTMPSGMSAAVLECQRTFGAMPCSLHGRGSAMSLYDEFQARREASSSSAMDESCLPRPVVRMMPFPWLAAPTSIDWASYANQIPVSATFGSPIMSTAASAAHPFVINDHSGGSSTGLETEWGLCDECFHDYDATVADLTALLRDQSLPRPLSIHWVADPSTATSARSTTATPLRANGPLALPHDGEPPIAGSAPGLVHGTVTLQLSNRMEQDRTFIDKALLARPPCRSVVLALKAIVDSAGLPRTAVSSFVVTLSVLSFAASWRGVQPSDSDRSHGASLLKQGLPHLPLDDDIGNSERGSGSPDGDGPTTAMFGPEVFPIFNAAPTSTSTPSMARARPKSTVIAHRPRAQRSGGDSHEAAWAIDAEAGSKLDAAEAALAAARAREAAHLFTDYCAFFAARGAFDPGRMHLLLTGVAERATPSPMALWVVQCPAAPCNAAVDCVEIGLYRALLRDCLTFLESQ